MMRKALLICGIVSSLYYIAINIIVPIQDPGYSAVSQTISELSAIGASTRTLWVSLVAFYSVLLVAFAWGIWLSAGKNRSLRLVATLMGIYGFSGFFWPPMHQREVLTAGGGSMTDTIHIAFGYFTVTLMLLMMVLGAMAMGKGFRYYTIITIGLLLFFGALTGIQGSKMDEGLPTPMIGVWERINLGVFMIWNMVFGFRLIKAHETSPVWKAAT